MGLDLISNPRMDKGRKHHRPALLASLLFHTLAVSSVVALTLYYGSHLPPLTNGSAPGAASISLEEIVVEAPTPKPAPQPIPTPPVEVAPAPTPPAVVETPLTPPKKSEPAPQPLKAAVPVLAERPRKPTPPTPRVATKPASTTQVPSSHSALAKAKAQSDSKPTAAASASNYAPGPSSLPHPPYPEEARDQHRIGTVVVNVLFDSNGNVARTEVAETSGVPLLDSSTVSFIRQHWHNTAYAGQIISVPIRYNLTDM